MKIREKIMLDYEGLAKYGPINIVVLGYSVSHGAVTDNIDYENVYWNRLKKKLNSFRDYVPVNVINASISGTTAKMALPRLDAQVLKHEPDLVIVCFGLNDVNGPLDEYVSSMSEIFARCKSAGADVIFMTPNMLNTRVARDTEKELYEYAHVTAEMQNGGKMDEYIAQAIRAAEEQGARLCDCYAKWKEIAKTEDITMLLANRINHPTSEMHELFARSLYELIMGDRENGEAAESAMSCGQ